MKYGGQYFVIGTIIGVYIVGLFDGVSLMANARLSWGGVILGFGLGFLVFHYKIKLVSEKEKV